MSEALINPRGPDFIYHERDVLLGKKIEFPTGSAWDIKKIAATVKTTSTVGNRVIKLIVYNSSDQAQHTFAANHNALVASKTFNINWQYKGVDSHLDNVWEIEAETNVIHLESTEYLKVLDGATPSVIDAADTMDIYIEAVHAASDA
jgi:hypothetical protein